MRISPAGVLIPAFLRAQPRRLALVSALRELRILEDDLRLRRQGVCEPGRWGGIYPVATRFSFSLRLHTQINGESDHTRRPQEVTVLEV